MKKLVSLILFVAGMMAIAFMPGSKTIAAAESGSVAAAAQGTFVGAAAFRSVTLTGVELGAGVLIEPDGSAIGAFNAVLQGRSLLNQSQQIVIDGQAIQGAIAPNGRAYFNGVATIDLGNGGPPLTGVPFTVTTSADTLLLSLDTTTLPAMQLTAGTISIE